MNTIENLKEYTKDTNFDIKYNYRVTKVDLSNPKAKKLHDRIIGLLRIGVQNEALEVLRELNKLFGSVICYDHNIVPTTGLTLLAKGLSGNLSALADLEINYGAIGTGTGTPSLANTQLGSEQFRKTDSSLTYTAGIVYVTMFYSATDFTTTGAMGNIKEHGLFINGGTGVNTGTLWSRLLLNSPTGVSKTNLQSLTIDYEVSFTNA